MDRDVDCETCGAATSGAAFCSECQPCPRGHTGARQLTDEIGGSIENALHCAKCPANYAKVRGRWFEMPATPTPEPTR